MTPVSRLVRSPSRLETRMPNYRVNIPISFPPDRHIDAGEVVSDIPSKSIKWLLEQAVIEPVDAVKDSAPVVEDDEVEE